IRTDAPVEIDLEQVYWGRFDAREVARVFGELRFTALLDRVLSTLGGQANSETAGVAPGTSQATSASTSTPWTQMKGGEALKALRDWSTSEAWLGVALDDGTGESLFAVRRDLAVAHDGSIALIEGDHAEEAFATLLGSARVAAGDTKSLLHELCPHATPERASALDAVDPARLFDCAIAAYLLESNRSSYALAALSADYLSEPVGHTDDQGRAALEARIAALLAPELQTRLSDDGSSQVMRDIEMPLVPVLTRMEDAGIGLDVTVLKELSIETAASIGTLVTEIYECAGTDFSIDSPKQLAEILFEKLGLPPQKRTKTGFSTDASVLATLAQLHPIAEKVVAYRELAKLKSTYIDALPSLVAADGRIHTSFNQTVAATGRLSSSAPNLQNIPVRTEFGRRVRAAFVPACAGDLIVSADYSQIELRVLAHLSNDTGLIEAFTSGADFHAATAARVFGVSVHDVEPGMRARAKAVNFGIVYGQSAHGLADSLKIPHIEAQAMIDRYYDAYPRVRAYLDETVADAHRHGFAVTLFGRKRRIPELKTGNHNLRAFGERTAMNHPMQGTAADIMKLAMIEVDLRLRAEGFESRMLLQVHDELVFEAPASELKALSLMAREAMGGVARLAVPLEVSVASGVNWACAK
ncbi:MAG: DNA polymerase I, partial [Coriobacteriia bacterium]|nr:DNA polymerase I [Coriobacteriia bacterium]